MKILSQYIQRVVTSAMIATAILFIGLTIFIGFFGEVKDIGQGDYGLWQAFVFILLQIPCQFYVLFPMVGLIGSLVGLGLLASHQELTVMRAAGVSIFKITRVVLGTMIIIIVIMVVIGELFAPYLNAVAQHYKEVAQNSGQTLAIGNSVWLKEQNDFIYVSEISSANELRGVTIYEFNDQHQLIKNITARSASYSNDQWVLNHVSESDISTAGVKAKFYRTLPSDVHLTPDVFRMTLLDPSEMNLVELWRFIKAKQENGLRATSYQINFWQRVYQPLSIIIMMLLALPFVFGSSRGLTMGFRLFIGVIVGFAFVMLTNIAGQVGLLVTLPPALSTLFPLLIFGFLGLILVKSLIK